MCRAAAPEEVQKAFDEEIAKLQVLEPSSSEYNVTRNYIDWLTNMPWGVTNKETFDIDFARKCLDSAHYGMNDVKDRILEFIAVGKLNDQVSTDCVKCISRACAWDSICLVSRSMVHCKPPLFSLPPFRLSLAWLAPSCIPCCCAFDCHAHGICV